MPIPTRPDESIVTLVLPPVETLILSPPPLKIPEFKSDLKASAGADAEPSSRVIVPSSCKSSFQPELDEFLILRTPAEVSAHH